MKLINSIFLILLFLNFSYAQSDTANTVIKNLKTCNAVRTTQKITIDGNLNDEAWKTATVFNKFIEWRPSFGKIESDKNRTDVYLLYDDNAFYIAGYCHEASVDSISKELVGRDVVGVNDFVGIIFDTYHDKINGFGYYVTPLGEQFDAKYSSNGEDASWNSVYETQSKIVQDGWVFEMKIPYAAIRFVAKPNQTWGVNITRRRSKSGQQLMWNPVNPNIGGSFLAQFGNLTQINNIKPPVRLSFSPYISINSTNTDKNENIRDNYFTTINGGMDIKYGINQAYTLDATLVPDFGQVQSDNVVLNLSPFEIKYNEYRPFFTEGTELFNKANLLYSRRIGSVNDDVVSQLINVKLKNGDSVVSFNSSNTKIVNAVKVSGRNKKGLGIGVLNAITAPQYATAYIASSKTNEEIEVNPLTNFSVLVLDQTLKNNSSISLLNTNVWRSGMAYDANVTCGLWDFYNKTNTWNFNGKFAVSNLHGYEGEGKNTTGINYAVGYGKVGGRFNFNVWQEFTNDKYQQNDLGYATNPNFFDNGVWATYKWTEPKKWYNRINLNYNAWISMRYKPWDYQNFGTNINANAQLKNLWNVGYNIWYNAASNDFYEPRVSGYVFKRPANWGNGFWINSNDAKKYSASFEFYMANRPSLKGFGFSTTLTNQYRFNSKLTIWLANFVDVTNNGKGFAYYDDTLNSPIVGLRQQLTSENTFNIKYNFNNKMGITFRARHYWSRVYYEGLSLLQPNGDEVLLNTKETATRNVNLFNIDMTYSWQFALGSFITINWKDASWYFNDEKQYFKNFSNTLTQPQHNNFSIKVIYFLDYLNLKKSK